MCLAGAAFAEPVLSENAGSAWSISLTVNVHEFTFGGWLKIKRRAYNAQLTGPTWKIKRGDTVTVSLVRVSVHTVIGTVPANRMIF